MEYKIGDRVKVVPYEELPKESKNKGIAHVCDREGQIVDKLYSDKAQGYIYKVQLDTFRSPSSIDFTDRMLTLTGGGVKGIEVKLTIEADGVAIEMFKGGERLKRCFGKLLYEGEYGIAQATSWAAKLLMRSFEENYYD